MARYAYVNGRYESIIATRACISRIAATSSLTGVYEVVGVSRRQADRRGPACRPARPVFARTSNRLAGLAPDARFHHARADATQPSA